MKGMDAGLLMNRTIKHATRRVFIFVGSKTLSEIDTKFVQHYNRAMKNVTIKLEDDVAHWSRIWAAEHNTSVSQILGDLLKQMKQEKTGYAIAMQQFFNGEPQPMKKAGKYPSRDDLHER